MPIIDSFGLEYEFSTLPFSVARKILPRGWVLDRDGSVTRQAHCLGSLVLNTADAPTLSDLPVDNIGGEFISPILSFEDIEPAVDQIDRLLNGIFNHGEVPSDYASVHIHICVGQPPVRVLRNLIKLGLATEHAFFRLSIGEFGHHRGVSHGDYKYCRPITGAGPQIVRGQDTWYYAFNIDRVLSAKSAELLFMGWCRSDYQPSKWVPARYYWLNMAAIPSKGTLEFRLFNQTLKPKYIRAWLDLCRAFVIQCWSSHSIDADQMPLGTTGARLEDLLALIPPNLFEFRDTVKTLEELWFKGCNLRPAMPQINHLCLERSRTVPIEDAPYEVRPDVAPRDLVDYILNQD